MDTRRRLELDPISGTKIAVIVERQLLVVPFLQEVVRDAGASSVYTFRSASARTLERVRPDVILLGVDATARPPLEVVRRTRAAAPLATLVVLTRSRDRTWSLLARALGADVVLDGDADRHDLISAVLGSLTHARA